MNREASPRPALGALALALVLGLQVRAHAAPSPAGPVLEIKKAVYRLDQNVLEFSFTLRNPGDTALFLDCEIQPVASRQGRTLRLDFAREPGGDSARPQRIGARQGYQGHRRIHGLGPDTLGAPGHPTDPAAATTLSVGMAAYPERMEGEGEAWDAGRGFAVEAAAVRLEKRGKRPKAQVIRLKNEK